MSHLLRRCSCDVLIAAQSFTAAPQLAIAVAVPVRIPAKLESFGPLDYLVIGHKFVCNIIEVTKHGSKYEGSILQRFVVSE